MKITNRLLSVLLALALVLSLPCTLPSALAANQDVSTFAELKAALSSSQSGDTIRLTAGIVYAEDANITGKNLTIDLNGKALSFAGPGIALKLDNAKISVLGFASGGALNVSGSSGNDSLLAINGSEITVSRSANSSSGTAASATSGSKITVLGDAVSQNGRAVWAQDAGTSVTVGGNAESLSTGDVQALHAQAGAVVSVAGRVSGGKAVSATGTDTLVTVRGDLTSTANVGSRGVISANQGAKVVVTEGSAFCTGGSWNDGAIIAETGGQVDIRSGSFTSVGIGLGALNPGSSINVGGSVTSVRGSVSVRYDARVTVGGSVNTTGASDRAVYSYGGSNYVSVGGYILSASPSYAAAEINTGTFALGGSILSEGSGLVAAAGTTVSIIGDVKAKSAYAVQTSGNAVVNIGGNVSAGYDTLGNTGSGVYASTGGAQVTVDGYIQAADYIYVNGAYKNSTPASATTPTTKAGYRTYTTTAANASTVWVKDLPDTQKPQAGWLSHNKTEMSYSSVNQILRIKFNETMATSGGSVVIVTDPAANAVTLTNPIWTDANRTYQVSMNGIKSDTVYNVTLSGFADFAGNVMDVFGFSFATATDQIPPRVGFNKTEGQVSASNFEALTVSLYEAMYLVNGGALLDAANAPGMKGTLFDITRDGLPFDDYRVTYDSGNRQLVLIPDAPDSFPNGVYKVTVKKGILEDVQHLTYTDDIVLNFTMNLPVICEIVGGAQFTNARLAFDAAQDGQTLKLLRSSTYYYGTYNRVPIEISDKEIAINTNGYYLTLSASSNTDALAVTNGSIFLTGSGSFSINGSNKPLVVTGPNSRVTVSSVDGFVNTSQEDISVSALGGAKVTVNGRVEISEIGAYADGAGSEITIGGSMSTSYNNTTLLKAINGGKITLTNGNATVSTAGYSSYSGFGAYADNGGVIEVLTGYVRGSDVGAFAGNDSSVYIAGNLYTHRSNPAAATGVKVTGSGRVTVDGRIQNEYGSTPHLPATYAIVNGAVKDGSPESRTVPSSKPGYFEYSQDGGFFWCKSDPTDDIIAPTVVSTIPAGNAKDVPVSTNKLTATFNEIMDPSFGQIRQYSPGSAILTNPVWSSDYKSVTYDLPALAYNTSYYFSIESFRDLAGNALRSDHSIIFTTEKEAVAPVLTSWSFGEGQTYTLETPASLSFDVDSPLYLASSGEALTSGNIAGLVSVTRDGEAFASFDLAVSGGTRVTITPNGFMPNGVYTVSVNAGIVKNADGIELAAYSRSFSLALHYVCAIGQTQYTTLSKALEDHNGGETITLLESIAATDTVVINNKSIVFGLGEFDLSVGGFDFDGAVQSYTTSGGRLLAKEMKIRGASSAELHGSPSGINAKQIYGASTVKIDGDVAGASGFEVSGEGTALYVHGTVNTTGGSAIHASLEAFVNVDGSVACPAGKAAVAESGASIFVTGDVSGAIGVSSDGQGSVVALDGSVSAQTTGARASNGGLVSIPYGSVEASAGTGAEALSGGQIWVDAGFIKGTLNAASASGNDSMIFAGADLTASQVSGTGALIAGNSEITVNGIISAHEYASINGAIKDGSLNSRTLPTTKEGYKTFSNNGGSLWVLRTAGEAALAGLQVTVLPNKTVYFKDESLNFFGLVVSAIYADGLSAEVTGYTASPADGDILGSAGTVTVELSYTENAVTKTASFDITVNEPTAELTGITLTSLPSKLAYFVGESLDLSGLTVCADYSDGSSIEITGYTVSPEDGTALTTAGSQPVTVSYMGFEKSFNVTVNPALLDRIAISSAPDKLVYTQGDELDLSGLEVTAYYSDGSSAVVTGFVTTPEDNELLFAAGTRSVTVSYGEGGLTKTASFDITVYIKVTVSTPILVETLSAYLNITAGASSFDGETVKAYLAELPDGTDIASGKGRMYIQAAPLKGIYNLVLKTPSGKTAGFCEITVVEYDAQALWHPTAAEDTDGKLLLIFGGAVSAKDGKLDKEITIGRLNPACSWSADTPNIIKVDMLYSDAVGKTIAAKGIKYTVLFPSYSFTFTFTIE